jgi:hypothetical protein
MKISTIFLYALFFCGSLWAQSDNLLKSWDSRVYNPIDSGLTSLSFEARVSGLTEALKSSLILPNISAVFFQVTWNPKNKFTVKLVGLPTGFIEIKNSLELTMLDKLRFFIPNKINDLTQGYEFSTQKSDSGSQYTLDDKTFLKTITKIEVFFDGEKNLSKLDFRGTNIREVNTFTFDNQAGPSKLLLKNLLVEAVGAQSVVAVNYAVSYSQVDKYFFPKSISVTSQIQSLVGEKGQKQVFAESKSKITFSNFLVK